MTGVRGHLLLALAILVGSAIPLVPTGELVSGAAALAANSGLHVVAIFLITWVCSVLGDTILLAEARYGARWWRPRLHRSRLGRRVQRAETAISGNALSAIITGRLVPGGRTPVILALGLSRYPVRRFVMIDTLAAALWAAVYTTIGSIGGRVADHPVWAMVFAVAGAVSLSLVAQAFLKVLAKRRLRATGARRP